VNLSSLAECYKGHFASIFNIEVLETEAAGSYELLGLIFRTTRRHIPEGNSYLSVPKKLIEI
jgi:hypothetical protein